MKKLILLLSSFCLLLCLCACDESPASVPESSSQAVTESLPQEEPQSTPESSSESTSAEETAAQEEAPLYVAYTHAFSYRDGSGVIRAIGIAQIANHSDAPLALPACTMEFTDAGGAAVYTADTVAAVPPVIAPGECAWYYEQIEPDLADTCDLSLSLTLPDPASAEAVRYEVGETLLRDSPYGGLVLSGKVSNPTEQDGELVCVAAVLLDEADTPLAVVQTVLMQPLAAGQTAEFYIEDFLLPTELTADAVASVQVFAYPL